MRVTQSMYYNNIFGANNSKLNKELFDVNKQIASGLTIQYASDDVAVFSETMRLDNELTTLGQIQKSTENGYKISNQTDIVLNQFNDTMNRMRTLVIQASSDVNDESSTDAIATELEGIKENLMNLANTSINGQFLFSGSAVDTKPISEDGVYHGNDVGRNALLGSNNKQQYNLTGAEFFLGEESGVSREITTNVVNRNILEEYPEFQVSTTEDVKSLSASSPIRELMGDTDNIIDPNDKHYFYVRGTSSNGTAFKEKIVMKDEDRVEDLLSKIGTAYGNTGNISVVNISMNSSGQIVVEDKIKGSSKLDFHMVGAVDFANTGAADVTNIDDLDSGETDFDKVVATPGLFIKEFVKSNMTSSQGGGVGGDVATSIHAAVYDRAEFTVNGSTLSSTAPQILKDTNEFATASTKLSEVADLSQTNSGTLDGTSLKLVGTGINGSSYNAVIDLKSEANGGSTFSLDTDFDGTPDTTYNIYNMDLARINVDADEMTYQQLMDVVNMVATNQLPSSSPGSDTEYDSAVKLSNNNASTFLSYDGKIEFKDLTSSNTKVTMSLYDANSNGFTTNASGEVTDGASVMRFNVNNALTIRDAKTDFFKTIDEVISAVKNYSFHPNADSDDVRNLGMENALAMLDDVMDHTNRVHAIVGAQSNALTNSMERVGLLEISTTTLRSSVIDTDLAESAMRLSQLTMNYEAMLSTVGKVSQLSLVNYL